MILDGPRHDLDAAVEVPTSKSLTNRALVAAAVAGGGTIRQPLDCDDTRVLASALERAGWPIEWRGGWVVVGPRLLPPGPVEVSLADSGTGARLVIALLAATPGRFVVDGSRRLRERPMKPLIDALLRLGARLDSSDGRLPVTIDGTTLRGGRITIRPGVSSQFVSALLLAGPLMTDGIDVEVSGTLPSRPYVRLTVDMLRSFKAEVDHKPLSPRWRVRGGGACPSEVMIEGDWSAVAFFTSAVAITGGRIRVSPVTLDSRQGDRAISEVAGLAGVTTSPTGSGIEVLGPARLPFRADLTDAPDMFPALAAMAACCPPGSVMTGLDHLKHKESDRLSVMVENLRRLGAGVDVSPSSVHVVRNVETRPDAVRAVTAAGDHRVAMAMAVTALGAGPLRVDDPHCVSKSFPDFWEVWGELIGSSAGGRT